MSLNNNYITYVLEENPDVKFYGNAARMAKKPRWWSVTVTMLLEGENREMERVVMNMKSKFKCLPTSLSQEIGDTLRDYINGRKFEEGRVVARIIT